MDYTSLLLHRAEKLREAHGELIPSCYVLNILETRGLYRPNQRNGGGLLFNRNVIRLLSDETSPDPENISYENLKELLLHTRGYTSMGLKTFTGRLRAKGFRGSLKEVIRRIKSVKPRSINLFPQNPNVVLHRYSYDSQGCLVIEIEKLDWSFNGYKHGKPFSFFLFRGDDRSQLEFRLDVFYQVISKLDL